MNTEMFGRYWQQYTKEKKITIPTSINSCNDLSNVFESVNIKTIAIISKCNWGTFNNLENEIIAASEIVSLKSIILVHGKLRSNAVMFTIRSDSIELSDMMCRFLQKCLK